MEYSTNALIFKLEAARNQAQEYLDWTVKNEPKYVKFIQELTETIEMLNLLIANWK